MTYAVKEMFRTLQGEGARTGRVAVFCRFTGCNLWSGRERDREKAQCTFCDTDFVGTDGENGARFATADALADRVAEIWGDSFSQRYVVCTGGEPLLQLDEELIAAFHARGFEVAVETNGTVLPPAGIDWLCVSPKAGADVIVKSGSELKLVYPQSALAPDTMEGWAFDHFFLQPLDSPLRAENTEMAMSYCLQNPRWRLSLQTHKILGIQ
jgi:7-carboxy-7-deazaguanine synthase (Cx14CxxC type)